MLRGVALFALMWFSSVAGALAQFDVLDDTYGRGVHAYFASDFVAANEFLSEAIDAGSEDPRCFYFRGLTLLRMGSQSEAEADFVEGALREVADVDRFYAVSKALERVQGRARQLLERHRAHARMTAFQEQERLRTERYDRIRRDQADVTDQGLDDEEPAAEEMPADDEAEPEFVQPAEDESTDDPFAEDAGGDEEMPADDEQPVADEPAGDEPAADASDENLDDPFADDAGGEQPADNEDPFAEDAGGDEEMPAEDDPFAEPAADDEEMPADDGDDAATDEDPFAADEPAADSTESGDEDPFAEDAADSDAEPAGDSDDDSADPDDDPFAN